MENKQLVLYVDKNANIEEAKNIAKRLNIEIITNNKENFDIVLSMDENGLSLVSDNMKLYGDFSKGNKRNIILYVYLYINIYYLFHLCKISLLE